MSRKSALSIIVMFFMVLGLFAGVGMPVVHAAGTPIAIPNGSFENGIASWTTDFTAENSTSPISTTGDWIPTGGGTTRLNYWSNVAYTANIHQTITGLKNGSYTLSAWVESGVGFNENYMYAKDTGTAEVKASVPRKNTWEQISLSVVVTKNELTIGFYANGMATENFMGVDLVTLVLDEAAPAKVVQNTSFENDLTGWETSFGPEGIGTPIEIKLGWSPENGGTKRVNYWSANAYTADTFQTVTELENGKYTLSAWVARGDGFTKSYMYAKDTGRGEVKVDVPVSSSSWTKISLPVVIENNTATIGFYADGAADKWMSFDLITLVKDEEVELEPVGVAIGNHSFQATNESQAIDSWLEEGDVDASYTEGPGYLSSYGLTHYSDTNFKVATSQTISGLENGYYTLTAWTQNSGGQNASYIFSRDNGTSEARAAVPIGSTWTKVYLRGIHVTNGTATIGLFSDAKAGNWTKFDFVELVKDDKPYRLLKGGDVSELTYVESQGGKFYDSNGIEKDLFHVLKENGHDIVRIRVYNEPGKGHGDGSYYRPAGIMDKDDILKLAKRAKAAGLQIQFSFHYSDYWTNAQTHMIPNAWQKEINTLTDDASKVTKLTELLHAYTYEVMKALVDQGTTPEFVSLGNEMQSGILFPYGNATGDKWTNLGKFLKAGADAVKSASPTSKIILHLDDAGNKEKYETFFDKMKTMEVPYDIIGPSYYPFWTKDTIEQIVDFCNYFSEKYDKDIMIMETGYNWNPMLPNGTIGQLNDNGPYPADTSSPQGQKDFMINLFNGLKSVNNGRVIGDLYWDPIMIAVPGVGWAIKEIDDQPDLNVVSNTTLFDFNGKALPSHDAYKQNTEGSNTGHISGVIRGSGGNPIAHAKITVSVGDSTYNFQSDAVGNYFIPDLPVNETYEVIAEKKGYRGDNKEVTLINKGEFTTEQNITFIGGSITGVVKDRDNKVVAAAKVSTVIDGTTYSTVTDALGQYTLADLPAAASVSVTAAKDGYANGVVNGAAIAIGATTSSIDLSVTLTSGTITGTIKDSNQAPIAEAVVSLTIDGKKYSASSNSAGEYTLVNVPAGSNYKLTAMKLGYVNTESSLVSVQVGQTTSDIHFTMKNNFGTITGYVVDPSSSPVKDATVVAVKGANKYTVQTDASGKYVIEDVLGDRGYVVTVSKEGYLSSSTSAVDVVAFMTTTTPKLKLASIVPLKNASFEIHGVDKYSIPDWTLVGTPDATFTSGDNPKDGKSVLNLWHGSAYKSDASQTITGLENGNYTVSAWFYNGGDMNEYYMYAKDSKGELARINIPKAGSMTPFSMDVKVVNGEMTVGFYADANAENWALVDLVTIGYKGPEEVVTTPTSPTESIPTQNPQVVKVDLKQGQLNAKDQTVTVNVIPAAGATGITAQISIQQITELANEKLKAIIVNAGFAQVSVSPDMFKTYSNNSASIVELSIVKVESKDLSSDMKKAVGDNVVYDFNLSVDGVKLPQFEKNVVKVELPYTLKQGEQAHNVVIYYIKEDGKLEVVKNARYDAVKGTVTFSPSHFSKYTAVYKVSVFTDLAKVEWAKESIEYLAARGMVSGFEDQTFKPGNTVTRAQFIHMLTGVLELSADGAKATFSDVKEGAWYTSSIAIAQKLGIVKGKSDGSFGVNDKISREEMAVMMYRAAKEANVSFGTQTNMETFTDQAQIADYAAEAVEQMQQAGLVNGVGQGAFAPKGHATRAQAAVILDRWFQIIYSIN